MYSKLYNFLELGRKKSISRFRPLAGHFLAKSSNTIFFHFSDFQEIPRQNCYYWCSRPPRNSSLFFKTSKTHDTTMLNTTFSFDAKLQNFPART